MIASYSEAKVRAEDALKKAKRSFIGNQEDAASHVVDNEFIRSGYRINHHSCCRSFKSLFTCHNETVNVWSHLLGAIFFLILLMGLIVWVVPQ